MTEFISVFIFKFTIRTAARVSHSLFQDDSKHDVLWRHHELKKPGGGFLSELFFDGFS